MWLLLSDGMRRPVSGRDAVYAPKLVLRTELQRLHEALNTHPFFIEAATETDRALRLLQTV